MVGKRLLEALVLTDRFPNPKLNIHEIDMVNKTTMFNGKSKDSIKTVPWNYGSSP